MAKRQKQPILFTGGGTLGPVTPLIAIARAWQRREPEVDIAWIGTPQGPERMIVEEAGFDFTAMRTPKLDREKKWTWPFIPFFMLYSLGRSVYLLRKLRPKMVFTAGGYVSIPVVWVAWLMRIPTWVHQLDLVPGIANRVMAPFAKRISVSWLDSLESFPEEKTRQVGSLVRDEMMEGQAARAIEQYDIDPKKPTLFVLGGGTGAQSVNSAMEAIGSDLVKDMNVLHLTGRGKMTARLQSLGKNYIALEFIGADIVDMYAAADLVICRAGMGTILELSALEKAAIVIPIGNTDQLANAKALEDAGAAEVIHRLNGQILRQKIRELMDDDATRLALGETIGELFVKNGEERIVEEAMSLVA